MYGERSGHCVCMERDQVTVYNLVALISGERSGHRLCMERGQVIVHVWREIRSLCKKIGCPVHVSCKKVWSPFMWREVRSPCMNGEIMSPCIKLGCPVCGEVRDRVPGGERSGTVYLWECSGQIL